MPKYNLPLTSKQIELLKDIADMWLEEFEPATSDVERDRSLNTPEELLASLDGMHNMFSEVNDIREVLRRVERASTPC